jgi:hypothetical protein
LGVHCGLIAAAAAAAVVLLPCPALQLLDTSPDPTTEVLVLRLLVQLVSFPQLKAATLK